MIASCHSRSFSVARGPGPPALISPTVFGLKCLPCVAAESAQWDAAPPAEAANNGEWAQAADPATGDDWGAAEAPAADAPPASNGATGGDFSAPEAPEAANGDWAATETKDFGANY